jgi:hypothetical protein
MGVVPNQKKTNVNYPALADGASCFLAQRVEGGAPQALRTTSPDLLSTFREAF